MEPHLILAVVILIVCPVKSYEIIHSSDGDMLRIPFVRMQSGFELLLERGASFELIEGLRKMARSPPRDNDTLPLFKYFDTEYYGLINIGKPGKQFAMAMDTEWTHSWVTSVDCPKISLPCAVHNRYNHKLSSTYQADGRPFNMAGQLTGYYSKDVFLVGQMNSTNQSFVEMSKIPWIYSLTKSDGVIGLALKGRGDYTPFFMNFLEQNKLKEPIFSFYVNRDPTTIHGGSILFGGIDTRHKKGPFTTVNIIDDTYWRFRVAKISLVISSKEKEDFCKNGCTATADTSTSTIVGPPADIKKINTLIGAERTLFDRAMIPCSTEYKGPKFNLTIGNTNFLVLARDYVQKLSYSGMTVCLSAFVPAEEGTQPVSDWRLGGAFLYQYYTAFNIVEHTIMIADAA